MNVVTQKNGKSGVWKMNKYKEALDNIEYYLCELEGIKTQVRNVYCIYDENLEALKNEDE